MEWMLLPYRRYADFNGRSRRKEYWMFQLFIMIVFVGTFLIVAGGIAANGDGPGPIGFVGVAILVPFWLATIIPALAVTVRRLHDQDKSGWLVLLNFVPYVGGIIVLVFMCLEGTRGPNRYGDDPKDPANAAIFA